jgi:hypothetical protein
MKSIARILILTAVMTLPETYYIATGLKQEAGRFDELESSLSNRYENLINSHRVQGSYRML